METQFSPEAEAGLLGSILLEASRVMPKCIEREISPNHFYDLRNRKIFEILQKMDFQKIDLVSVSDQLRENASEIPIEYFSELSDSVDVSAYSESYMEILEKTFRKREMLGKLQEMAVSVEKGKTKTTETLFQEIQKFRERGGDNFPEIIDAADWCEREPPSAEPLLRDTFDLGDKVALIGPSKTRKTYFTLQLALCVATGHDFLNWAIEKPRKVLVLQFEIKDAHFHKRVNAVARAMGLSADALRGNLSIANLRGADFRASDIARIAKRERAELVIIDPLYKLIDGDENSAHDMKPILAVFDRVMRETGAALLYVHHDAKGSAGDRNMRDRGAGSGVVARDYDACFALTPHRDNESAVVVSALLRNYAPQPDFVAEFWSNKFKISDLPAVAETSRNARKKQEVTATDAEIIAQADCSMSEFRLRLKEKCGLTDSNARKVIDDFPANGKLERFRKPGSRETWIATPERIEQLKLDWKF
ncbi:AAA family ATPase [Pontiella sulfatireligans]|uniref:Regulatory protein RepA n=1 Tax=Pontiella sulfatireligans TaxID=2750658 RepID=A0A6C2UDF9_9BACT|nr:AAA family ATPase [Pontiella sulfatireligans]VGO18228.1 Regulatory protein RepA [Pontiella sulfatireligans]